MFLPNFYGKTIVNHKDGNKSNSKLYNLEWNTPSENSQHAHNNLLNKIGKQIKVTNMKTNKVKIYNNIIQFSKENNISIYKCRYSLKNNKLVSKLYQIELNNFNKNYLK